jgi:protein SCO1/2
MRDAHRDALRPSLVPRLFLAFAVACIALALGALVLRRCWSAESYTLPADTPAGGAPLWKAPAFSFVDQNGRSITPDWLRGAPYIVDFIFTRCSSACPMLTAKLVQLQQRTRSRALRFVSFSVDPEHDSPAVLHEYARTWSPHETRWHLLATRWESLAAVVSGYRVSVRGSSDPTNRIIHSDSFFLVDAAGMIRGVYASAESKELDRLVRDALAISVVAAAPREPFMSEQVEAWTPGARTGEQTVTDPVCNMRVRAVPETPHLRHGQRTVYFCSDTCRLAFAQNTGQP